MTFRRCSLRDRAREIPFFPFWLLATLTMSHYHLILILNFTLTLLPWAAE